MGHDEGRWHCVTGYLPESKSPEQQAFEELFEETGLTVGDLETFTVGHKLRITDGEGFQWTVHTFGCEVASKDLRLNWENDGYRWVRPRTLARYRPVPWFFDVLKAVERA